MRLCGEQHVADATIASRLGYRCNESLCIMCNNLEDVNTLEGDFLMRHSQGHVRCDTVASSASTTARVAAVVQRGGSFLSGSFVNKF